MSAKAKLEQLHPQLVEWVAEAAERLEVPGVAVGILLDGEEDYVYHGVTSITNPLPVDAGTIFQIGSTGKTIVGTAMMVLVERGLVDLSAPVRTYIPELRLQDESVAERVTVLQLLNHTAGWAGDFSPDTGYGDDCLERFIERMSEANQELPLGERVSYNNAALTVAGRVIEKITGKVFETAIQELVFDPVGLTEHFFFPWDIMTRRFAAGHTRRGDVLQVTPWEHDRRGNPSGGESATARDQIRYARFHMSDGWGVLRRETLRQMQTLTTPELETKQTEAFGITWMLREIDGVQIVSHGGSCTGHQSAFQMIPERGFALVALTNARHGLELLTELIDWSFEQYAGVAEPKVEPLDLAPDELAVYAGEYESHTGILTVTVEGDRLVARLTINPELLEESGGLEEGHEEPPLPFKILPENQFLILEGQYKGLQGGILHGPDGRITGLDLGRVFTRREGTGDRKDS